MSTAPDIPTSATRRSGQPSGLSLHRGVAQYTTPPLIRLLGCYALYLVIATGAVIGLLWASLGNIIVFRFLILICALLWVDTESLENLVKNRFSSKTYRAIALFVLNTMVYAFALLCGVLLIKLRDWHTEWFIATLVFAALSWAIYHGRAMARSRHR